MKRISYFALILGLIMLLTLSACSKVTGISDIIVSPESTGQIFLYGEKHGIDNILDMEFELWYEYYHNHGMRHLFVELSYFTAELMNVWMQSDNNDIIDEIYNDWSGTASYKPVVKEFYEKIKRECPETVFHGTDVGHQYFSTGERFLKYLENNNLEDSEQYLLTKEAIEQGIFYYEHSDHVYRENKMTDNFIREFEKLSDVNIMGIYGAAHTGLNSLDYTKAVACMANQLKERYGDAVFSVDLTKIRFKSSKKSD